MPTITQVQLQNGQIYDLPGGGQDVFIATFGSTTHAEISNAINDGKMVFVEWNGGYLTLERDGGSSNDHIFTGVLENNQLAFARCSTSNVWSPSTFTPQEQLVSGTNIKTINGNSVLGSGDLQVGSSLEYTKDAPDVGLSTNNVVQNDVNNNNSTGGYSLAEGYNTTASGGCSHAEGSGTTASGGEGSHAEGSGSTASRLASHAEGGSSTASGVCSHAEGQQTTASGGRSHAEGWGTNSVGDASHAEGYYTSATGSDSHAEGNRTSATGWYSHAQNYETKATRKSQTVIGEFNEEDTQGASASNRGKYALIIGNGTASNSRSNAFTVEWDGTVNIPSGATYCIDGVPIGGGGGETYTISISGDTITLTGSGGTTSSVTIPDEAFIATYGTTTYTEISNALTDGKIVFVKRNGGYLPLVRDGSGYVDGHVFSGVVGTLNNLSDTQLVYAFCNSQDTWSMQTFTPAERIHTHGNITSGGALQTTDVSVANGDKLVITDASGGGLVSRSDIEFDGTTDTKALTKKGSWEDFQEPLVSGTNIKTINGTSILGSGDITVASGGTPIPTADEVAEFDSDAHMNSTDMTTAQVDDFVDGLNVSGGGVVKTNVTPTSGTNYSGYGNCYYEVLGKLVHFHIGIGGLTANTTTKIYTMPSGLRPQTKIFAKGSGGTSLNYSSIELWDNGEIYVTSQGTYCGGELWYFV